MAGEDYNPSGDFPTFPLSLVKDGEPINFESYMKSADPKKGLFAKLIDAVGWLKTNAADVAAALAATTASADGAKLIGVEPKAGAGWAGGTLTAFLDVVVAFMSGLQADKQNVIIVPVTANDADTSYSVTATSNRVIHVPQVLGAARSYTLNDPATNGITVLFSRVYSTVTNDAFVKNSGGSTLTTLNIANHKWVTLRSVSGAWIVEARG